MTTHKKIYIYNVFRNFELRIPVETDYNPKGILEVNGADDPCFFAYLSKGKENIEYFLNKKRSGKGDYQ